MQREVCLCESLLLFVREYFLYAYELARAGICLPTHKQRAGVLTVADEPVLATEHGCETQLRLLRLCHRGEGDDAYQTACTPRALTTAVSPNLSRGRRQQSYGWLYSAGPRSSCTVAADGRVVPCCQVKAYVLLRLYRLEA